MPLARYLAALTAALSVLLAVIGFFVTGEGDAVLKGGIAIVIAILGSVLFVLLEVLARVQERGRAWDIFGGLMATIEDRPEVLPLIARIATASAQTLRESRVDFFEQQVTQQLYSASMRLEELAQGRWRCPPGGSALFEKFYPTASRVRAVTDDRDLDWWGSGVGARYLQLNKESPAAKTRIFIVGPAAQGDTAATERRKAILRVLKDNVDAGVEVYAASLVGLKNSPDVLHNVTIFDDTLVHQDVVNIEGSTVSYLWSQNATDVNRATERFDSLLAKAKRFPVREVHENDADLARRTAEFEAAIWKTGDGV